MPSFAQREEIREDREAKLSRDGGDGVDLIEQLSAGNIAEAISVSHTSDVISLYGTAKGTMEEWLRSYEKAVRLARMKPKTAKQTFPFNDASNAMAPFVLEAMVDFNARTAPELAYSDRIVQGKIYGGQSLPDVEEPPADLPEDLLEKATAEYQKQVAAVEQARKRIDTDKEGRADRVAEYSNYQLSELMPDWKEEQDKMLMALPCTGTAYKKTYYDSAAGAVCSDLCYADDVIFDMTYPTFRAAPDKFEKMPELSRNEVVENIRGVNKWDIREDELSTDADAEKYEFFQAITWLDLDDDGLAEPYLLIIWEEQQRTVYARPMYDEDTISYDPDDETIVAKVEMIGYYTQFQFMPDPFGGPMGLGWGIILGPTFEEINMGMRRLLDAGTIANLAANSGLIAEATSAGGRGNRSAKGPIEMALGKLTPVQTGGGNLAQNVVQFPAAGPNQTLFSLLEYMGDMARRLTDASSQQEAHANESATLFLARLTQTLKRPNVITTRIYNCAAKEFKAIALLNHMHFDDEAYNRVIDEEKEYSMERDFNPDDCDIRMVADPSQGSDIERIARAEAVLQNAKTEVSPVTDMRLATLNFYEVIGVADPESLVPPPSGPDEMTIMMQEQQKQDAEFRSREVAIKEQDLKLKENKQRMEGLKAQLEAVRAGEAQGVELDYKEAQISKMYAESLKSIADAGFADPMSTVKQIERDFIEYDYDPASGGFSPRA